LGFSLHSGIEATLTAMVPYVFPQFKGQAADFCDPGIQKLVPRLNECVDNAGNYVEK
jgi:hypothetical protein